MIPKDDHLVESYSKKHFFLTAALWILLGGTLFWAFIMIRDQVSMVIFLVLCFLIRLLAKHWGKKFNAIMFPKPFVGWAQKTNSYQIVAMAMKQQWSAAWIVFSVLPVIFLSVECRVWFQTVLDLDQMIVTNAYIEEIGRRKTGRRSRGGDILYIVTENGEKVKLNASLTEKQIQILNELIDKRQNVTIWYQASGTITKNSVWQIKKNELMIQEYNKERVIKNRNFAKTASISIISYLLFTTSFIVIFYMRKLNKLRNMED
ncbi:MAG: hypothetical protein A2521_08700 [Deltaproteobacteria bacterium RIFOXYD12_FULL_57_12]|nr:MAG: hypothetical protein A2521_08700 [Deltaproteobacteria bacterium RIFOXYD12_FULL_57_12]